MDISIKSQGEKEVKFDLESLKVEIEKYPMAESKNMFESFLILGYDDIFFQEKILKSALKLAKNHLKKNIREVEDIINLEKDISIKFYYRNLPTILNIITSDFSGTILDQKKIIENVFPVPPEIVVSNIGKDKLFNDKKYKCVVFSNIHNEVVNYGYGHIFYETKVHEYLNIYVPKAFVIISQYPFYDIFNKICEEIRVLFYRKVEIPIEIQIYNIINFVPAPIDHGLQLTLFLKQDLKLINFLKNQEDFFFSDIQEKYYVSKLSGYRETEINFFYLFNILSIDQILIIYFNLICGKTIAIFSEDITKLSIVLHLFHQFLYPLSPTENVSCLPPIKFFCSDIVEQNLVGFLCNYDDLEKYDPFREVKEGEFRCLTEEEENIHLAPLYFRCDYIFDINKNVFKEPDKCGSQKKEKYINENRKLNEYIKLLLNIVSGNKIKREPYTEVEEIALKLYINLNEISYKSFNALDHMDENLFSPFVEKYNLKMNRLILSFFYQFNLNLSFKYYKDISKYNGDYQMTKEQQINAKIKSQQETNLSDGEYLFISSFGKSVFGYNLDNFIGGYSSLEPKIYKGSKLIFENLIYFIKIKKLYDLEGKRMLDVLDFYDEIYNEYIYKDIDYNTFTFFEFYKYYFTSQDIALYFYNISNPEFVSGKIIKKNPRKIEYEFKYKKIALDQNIIFKYIYKLKQFDNKMKKNLFQNIIKFELKNKKVIRSYDNFITSEIEKYYIKNKIIDNIELLNFSILGIAILTVSKYKLILFSKEINEVISNLAFLTRTFTEIMLSVSLRVFAREKEKNYLIYKYYFDIYQTAIENKNIFPNDQLIILKKAIDKFTNSIELKNYEINFNKFNNVLDKKYNLDYNKYHIYTNNFILMQEINNQRLNIKIKFKCDKIKLEYPSVYNIGELYKVLCSFLHEYYRDLDYNIILKNKDEFNKIIIYLLFYIKVLNHGQEEISKSKNKRHGKNKDNTNPIKEKIFPEGIEQFLINCLEK